MSLAALSFQHAGIIQHKNDSIYSMINAQNGTRDLVNYAGMLSMRGTPMSAVDNMNTMYQLSQLGTQNEIASNQAYMKYLIDSEQEKAIRKLKEEEAKRLYLWG